MLCKLSLWACAYMLGRLAAYMLGLAYMCLIFSIGSVDPLWNETLTFAAVPISERTASCIASTGHAWAVPVLDMRGALCALYEVTIILNN